MCVGHVPRPCHHHPPHLHPPFPHHQPCPCPPRPPHFSPCPPCLPRPPPTSHAHAALITLTLTLTIAHAHALFAPLTSPLVPIPSTTHPPRPRPPLSHCQERMMWVAMVTMEMMGRG